MALYKEKTLDSGIILKYHRISEMLVITNIQNIISVTSYISAEKRQEEIDALAVGVESGEAIQTNIFMEKEIYSTPYDQTMTIASAYEYLKSLNNFKDSTDIL